MTDQTGEISNDGWQRLIAAREVYTRLAGGHYDEVLNQVAQRAQSEGSIGKADIGALLLWKRLRADTRWTYALMATSDAEVRRATAAAMTAVLDSSVSISEAARAGRAALVGLPGFTRGDALASAALTAAAPDRMAVYDRPAHTGLRSLGIPLTHAPGRYSRYIAALDHLLDHAPSPAHAWTPRDLDVALYSLPPIPADTNSA
ncbi:hypothetical protein [Streptomyces sp. NRRL F-5650]|uniref:hypothetical protein n=1 Tax=Streptomyces sp. NRRL F-5650 TaxID=1463868 RepID=UPI000AAB610A|nr:hypothetical protein [Streptomyces sp. NRRL F-5650]